MTLRETFGRLLGGDGESDEASEETEQGPPSHVCQSCGEEYYTDPELEINTCRSCGGVKVETASARQEA